MIAGQFFGKGSLFISVMLLSRYMSDDDFGALLFSVVLGQVLLYFSDMGVSLVVNRRASLVQKDSQELLSTAFSLRIVLGLSGWALLSASGYALGLRGERLGVLGIIGLSLVLESHAEMIYSVFRAGETMILEGLSRIAKGITGLALVLAAVKLEMGLSAIAWSYVIRTALALGIAVIGSGRIGISLRPLFNRSRMRELLVASLPLGIMGLLTVIQQRADTVVVRQMLGENAVAAWQECIRIVEMLLLMVVPTLLPGALFPSLCRSFSLGGYKRETADMARIFTGFAFAISLGIVSTGDRFLQLIWGASYLRGIDTGALQLCLYMSLAGLGIIYLANILLASLLALDRVKVVIPVSLGVLIIVILGNVLLIPAMGLAATGILFLSGNVIILVSYWTFLRWRGFSVPIWRETLISVTVGLPVLALTAVTRRTSFIPAFLIPAVSYFALWWVTGGGKALKRLFPAMFVREGTPDPEN